MNVEILHSDLQLVIAGPHGFLQICERCHNIGDICKNNCKEILCISCKKKWICPNWDTSANMNQAHITKLISYCKLWAQQHGISGTINYQQMKHINKFNLELSCHS